MDLVIDIQCVMNANNQHVSKEVAVLSLTDDYMGHWIVAPPYSGKKLPHAVKTTNKWLSRNKHGLEWENGYITKPSLISHLREITKKFEKVYVRGNVKKRILEAIIFNEIINVEDSSDADDEEKLPSFAELTSSNTHCILHATRTNSKIAYSCALKRVARLKNWLKTCRQQSFENISDEQFGNFESALFDSTAYGGCVPRSSDCGKVGKTMYIQI